MTKDIQDIVEEIVNSIDKTIRVESVDNAENRQMKIFVCELKWVKVGDVILDDQNRDSTVTEVGSNYIVIYKGEAFDWTSKYFTIVKDIYYFRGTPIATNAEWTDFKRTEEEKTPFVWLPDRITESFKGDSSGLERESPLNVFFFDITDFSKFTTKEHHDKVLRYLNAWVDGFIEVIRKNKKDFAFNTIADWDRTNFPLFGTEEQDGQGNVSFENWIFDANLSAVKLRLTLPIRKGAKCLC